MKHSYKYIRQNKKDQIKNFILIILKIKVKVTHNKNFENLN